MSENGGTWLENKKVEIDQQKRLFRDSKSREVFSHMLDMGEHNFAVNDKTARVLTVSELVGDLFNSCCEADWGLFYSAPLVVKTYQLGVGEGSYREQALKCVVPEAPQQLPGVKL